MDSRRTSRSVIDPKVRQVGFIPAAAPQLLPDRTQSCPPLASSPPSDLSPTGNSLSPVMIPPPRHASDNIHLPSRAVTVPGPARPAAGDELPVGSYNPSESLLGLSSGSSPVSPPLSKVNDLEFSENSSDWFRRSDSGKYATSFAGGGVDATTAKSSDFVENDSANLFVEKPLNEVSGAGKVPSTAVQVKNDLPPSSNSLKGKTTKAERRALQESQRAAKAAAKAEGNKAAAASGGVAPAYKKGNFSGKQPSQKKDNSSVTTSIAATEKKGLDRPQDKERKKDVPPPRMQFDDKNRVEKAKRHAVVKQTEARNRVELFRHLPQYEHGTQLPDLTSKFFQLDSMHPAIYKVGLQFLAGDISGGNARCIAMLKSFQESINNYSTPPEKTLVRDLTGKVSSYVSFLIECRPLSISMGNAIRFLKSCIVNLPLTLSESEAKATLLSDIDRFINHNIILADKVIVQHAVTKIRDGDVILTYASSSVVEMILLSAHELGKKFRVVIVDSRPKLEGQSLLRRLLVKGLRCTYTHINAVSYIMHEVTRVFLGASSVFANGTLYSRVGTACVAMVAHAFGVPVLVCCEAYKFHERVQLDSICSNELGNPDAISKVHDRMDVNLLDNWITKENLQLLNLTYDATPADYISMIITDYGMVPTTSVPVIVRQYREHLWV